jgi:hypothetical protein
MPFQSYCCFGEPRMLHDIAYAGIVIFALGLIYLGEIAGPK